jgi:hypothetical protein
MYHALKNRRMEHPEWLARIKTRINKKETAKIWLSPLLFKYAHKYLSPRPP